MVERCYLRIHTQIQDIHQGEGAKSARPVKHLYVGQDEDLIETLLKDSTKSESDDSDL